MTHHATNDPTGRDTSTSSGHAVPVNAAIDNALHAASIGNDATQEVPEEGLRIVVPDNVSMMALVGAHDTILRAIERAFPQVDVHVLGNEIAARGPAAELAILDSLVAEMLRVLKAGQPLTKDAVERSIRMLRDRTRERPADVLTTNIVSSRGNTIRPKTLGQKRYVDAIDTHTVNFGIGPAGTGKTYLAMAKAVQALQAKQVTRIILTRPAVEAGEKLGFLPGTLTDKIDPYLRPLYDALHDMVDPDSIPRLMATGTVEVAPLAFMRGRTINDAFIILDEAQNTTPEQMKMFLTRLGFGSRIVVTGDVTQVDLPGGTQSGLRVVQEILAGIEDVHFSYLTSEDVVRHRLVGEIVEAYGRWDAAHQQPHQRRAGRDTHRAGVTSPEQAGTAADATESAAQTTEQNPQEH